VGTQHGDGDWQITTDGTVSQDTVDASTEKRPSAPKIWRVHTAAVRNVLPMQENTLKRCGLGPLAIDDDGETVSPRLDRLTHAFKITALRHRFPGSRKTGHNDDRIEIRQLTRRHGTR